MNSPSIGLKTDGREVRTIASGAHVAVSSIAKSTRPASLAR
jgi:hypothetical protein